MYCTITHSLKHNRNRTSTSLRLKNLLRGELTETMWRAASAGKQWPTIALWWIGVRYTAGSDGVAMWSWVNGEEFNKNLPYVLSYICFVKLLRLV